MNSYSSSHARGLQRAILLSFLLDRRTDIGSFFEGLIGHVSQPTMVVGMIVSKPIEKGHCHAEAQQHCGGGFNPPVCPTSQRHSPL